MAPHVRPERGAFFLNERSERLKHWCQAGSSQTPVTRTIGVHLVTIPLKTFQEQPRIREKSYFLMTTTFTGHYQLVPRSIP